MRRLGAILAGGAARRFGSDKARAVFDGRMLLDHVADRLAPQCAAIVVVGRDWPGLTRIEDHPVAGLGPLGALAGALRHARDAGFTDVLTSGCDLPDLPATLGIMLAPGPAVIAGQPLLGCWPVSLADALAAHLAASDDRSMRGWIALCGARTVPCDRPIANINRPADLIALSDGSRPPA